MYCCTITDLRSVSFRFVGLVNVGKFHYPINIIRAQKTLYLYQSFIDAGQNRSNIHPTNDVVIYCTGCYTIVNIVVPDEIYVDE